MYEPFLWGHQLCSYSRFSHVHKSLPLVPILSQTNPVHTTPSHLFKINFNITHPPVLVFLVVSVLLAFPSKSYMDSFSAPIHATFPVHLILLDLSFQLCLQRVQVMKLIMQLSTASCHFIPLWSKHYPSHSVLYVPPLMSQNNMLSFL
jgi:hypothetical protein